MNSFKSMLFLKPKWNKSNNSLVLWCYANVPQKTDS